ncbi:MAG: YibE/F family protein [Patescibacteria group bacterium]
MRFKAVFAAISLAAVLAPAGFARAQDVPTSEVWRARMIEVVSQATDEPEGTVEMPFQVIRAELLSGGKKGKMVEVVNDHLKLSKGDTFFLQYVDDAEGEETYQALERDRLPVLLGLVAVFTLAILALGGKQGVRSILSLAGSFFVILYVLLPGILKGAPPVLMSVLVAGIVLVLALYSTHGWRRTTHAAFLGTISTVMMTGILATLAVRVAELTGFSSDEAVYLNTQLGGTLDARGLLLGGIIIGILGILDDIAITQASVVAELKSVGNRLSNGEIYARALRVGKEHVGALVNTLALAYTGSALPLLLLFISDKTPPLVALNGELVATEIVRTIVGSLGLVMAVPITTALAVLMVKPGDEGHEHVHGQPSHHAHYPG